MTPRRARCPDCRTTHVLLPGELVPRRADSASVIGQALVDKALGHGWRSIAEAWRRRISSAPPLWAVANFLAAGCLLAPRRR